MADMDNILHSSASPAAARSNSAGFALKLLTMAQAARLFEDPPHPTAVWRWCRKGVRGRNGQIVRLEHVRIGRKIFTTAEAITDFGRKLAEADVAANDTAEPGR